MELGKREGVVDGTRGRDMSGRWSWGKKEGEVEGVGARRKGR